MATLDATFHALADPTRRAILARLAGGQAAVSELARPFDMSLPAISKHLGVLERAGLLHRDRDGRVRRCRLDAAPLRDAAAWIERYRRFWSDQLDALATLLEDGGAGATEATDPAYQGGAAPAESRKPPRSSSRRASKGDQR